MFEKRHEPLASSHKFIMRLIKCTILGLSMTFIALLIGMLGYHGFEDMGWPDAFANAAMILSGMGPLQPLHTVSGEIFAGLYALFSGLAFIFIIGIVFSPIIHRMFHKFHLAEGS